MSTLAQITIEIARMRLSVVAGAYYKYNQTPAPNANKSIASSWLADRVIDGQLIMDDIRNAPLGSFGMQGADPAVNAKIDAAASVASQANDNALRALSGLKVARDALAKVDANETLIRDRLDALSDKVGALKIDENAVRVAVDSLIGSHFGRFTKLVEDRQAEPFIADQFSTHRVVRASCLDVFGIEVKDTKGNPLMVDVWNSPHAPSIDPDFIWTEGILRHLLLSDATGENLWFGGDKGTGKSETARQFSARTGRAFKRINFHKHTTVEEYIGAVGIENGKTVFQPKDFLTAYTSPSTVILLDEITNADPAELATLNGFLEPNACVSFGGMTHTRAEGVLVFVADNTFGNGDDSGRYAGTRLQNSALVDRFARVIHFDYLPPAFEIDAIHRRSGVNHKIAGMIYGAMHTARQRVKTADIVDAPSIRSAIAFARALRVLPPRDAWASAVVSRQPIESHAVLVGIYEACINESTIIDNL
jgi:MoxR-like ATPase